MHLIERAFGQIHDLQRRLEIAGGETAFRFRNDARDAAGNDTAAIFPGPRSQIDDPIRLCDGAHIMFDDYDRIAEQLRRTAQIKPRLDPVDLGAEDWNLAI